MIISRNSINLLVFVMEKQLVSCEVRGDCLNAARICSTMLAIRMYLYWLVR